jgi:hypothetical protein
MNQKLDPMTPVFFWMLLNRPGAVWIGTQKEWDWWNDPDGGKGEAPCLLHEGLAMNFEPGMADWSWWPENIRSVFGPEFDEDIGNWPVEWSCYPIANALGVPHF